ncbi:MAG: ATP-binding cassette domain-containing protein [Burkholderiaceae bacterium]
MIQETILLVDGVTFEFPQRPVFSHFSATIPVGITYVIGDESTGKSSLLRLFAGDLKPQAGSIAVCGMHQSDDLASFKKHVFWIDPRTTEHDQISPNDYFDMQRKFYLTFDEPLLDELIEGLSLSDHVSKAMYMLSAGSKRKVWLAAAFASGASATLLDEPFSALDKASINFLISLLATIANTTKRSWVIADYAIPRSLTANSTINLSI